MRAVRKPVEFEVFQYNGSLESARYIVMWASKHDQLIIYVDDHLWIVWEDESKTEIEARDYVIMNSKGGFYPCKPDIFEATYDVIEK